MVKTVEELALTICRIAQNRAITSEQATDAILQEIKPSHVFKDRENLTKVIREYRRTYTQLERVAKDVQKLLFVYNEVEGDDSESGDYGGWDGFGIP